AQKARTEYRIGPAALDRSQQGGNLRGVVLEVGVLHHQHVAGCQRNGLPDGRPLAAIGGLLVELVDLAQFQHLVEQLARAVAGAVINTDYLGVQGRGAHLVDQCFQGAHLVVDRDQHGNPDCHAGRLLRARSVASWSAAIMLEGSARPVPAMSSAVPWSGEVRTKGSPRVTLTPRPKDATLIAVIPTS